MIKFTMQIFRRYKMKYAPRYIIYLAVTKYLTVEQISCLNYDLKHSDIRQNHQFLAIIERYFDIETFKERPCIWQDVGLYYYIKHEAKPNFAKRGYIKKYEVEVILPKKIAFKDVYDGYLMLGVC